jgi:hypothetical protein
VLHDTGPLPPRVLGGLAMYLTSLLVAA